MTKDFPDFTPVQWRATEASKKFKYVLFGGSGGGGKSFWLRWWLVHWLISIHKNFGVSGVAGLFCEDYPSLENRQIKKIRSEMDNGWLGTWNASKREFALDKKFGGGIISCLNLDDPSKYRSAEFSAIAIDELTMNARDVFDNLLWRLRWPGVPRPRFIAATNPTGTGHQWVKKLWVDRNFSGESAALNPDEFAYVPAKATDNPHLPPDYFTVTLASLPEFMRKALMDGSWDVIEGQYFTVWDDKIHVAKPWEYQEGITDKWGIPLDWQRVGGIDWGRAKPWAALEAAIDPDGRLIVYRGVAEAGWEHERQADWLRAGSPKTTWYADDACWARGAANSQEARAQDMSHAELWARFGATNIMRAKKGDRVAGWQHLDIFLRKMPRRRKYEHRLKVEGFPGQGDMEGWWMPDKAWIEFFDVPGLRGDHGIITTLPKLIHDPSRPEDVDSSGDDHAGDALRYLTLSRPAPAFETKPLNPYREGDYFSNRGRETPESNDFEDFEEEHTTVVGDW